MTPIRRKNGWAGGGVKGLVRVELTREEAQRALAALRSYSVPRATWGTQDKFVVALHRQAERTR